ncbi:MAG: type II toxin-antitoxin system VapC family toxin [bacterium]|nr:type II toxin-antitoxin system VapC family toxin [bacterium]
MTNGFVADSSIGVSWAVESQSSPTTDQLLNDVASGRSFVVPALWMFEVGNTLLVLKRRKRLTPAECAHARAALGLLQPTVDDETPWIALNQISDLAENHRLSVYDATYLELALRRRLPLATRDSALRKAATRSGVAVL